MRLLKINPGLAEAWTNKGNALIVLGKYEEALKTYEEAIKANPTVWETWLNKGVLLNNMNLLDEAIVAFNEGDPTESQGPRCLV